DDVILTDTVVHLAPGEAMVCYTDGLTDRRSGRRAFGEEGVVAAVLHGRSDSAVEMAQRVEADAVAFVDAEPTDDRAVLVLKARRRRCSCAPPPGTARPASPIRAAWAPRCPRSTPTCWRCRRSTAVRPVPAGATWPPTPRRPSTASWCGRRR